MVNVVYLQIIIFLLEFLQISNYIQERTGYIVGGKIVDIEEYPFMVSLQANGEHFCGGTIVNKRWILTAAHCTEELTLFSMCAITVIAGSSDSKKRKCETCQRGRSKRCYVHQQYSRKPIRNDIALILLKKSLSLTEVVKKVSLGSASKNQGIDMFKLFDECTAVGWGLTSLTGGSCIGCQSNPLRCTTLPLMSIKDCKRKWSTGWYAMIKDTQICTYDSSWKHGVYKGDSGGPLVCGDKQQGIMSFVGNPKLGANLPTVYTRVDKYRSWIKKTIRSGVCSCSGYSFFLVLVLLVFHIFCRNIVITI